MKTEIKITERFAEGDRYLRIDCKPTRNADEVLALLYMAWMAEMTRYFPKDAVAERLHSLAEQLEGRDEVPFVPMPLAN